MPYFLTSMTRGLTLESKLDSSNGKSGPSEHSLHSGCHQSFLFLRCCMPSTPFVHKANIATKPRSRLMTSCDIAIQITDISPPQSTTGLDNTDRLTTYSGSMTKKIEPILGKIEANKG